MYYFYIYTIGKYFLINETKILETTHDNFKMCLFREEAKGWDA